MKIPLYQVDAFSGTLFRGNPAAVCPLETWLGDETLQAIAAENNLSETAFFIGKDSFYTLRWFTPKKEIDLAGHPTIATAYVIFRFLEPSLSEVFFETKSGRLSVKKEGALLTMDFPSTKALPSSAPDDLIKGLGKIPREVYRSRDYMAVYDSEQEIRDICPDLASLRNLDCVGTIITAPGENADFVSRFFAPGYGVDEDPVTGSTHCTLVPYWSERLQKKKLHALQLSERGGELFLEDKGERVNIAGEAVLYLEGKISIPV
jgi:PhzF family phenazine biosynthesis protein